MKTPNDKGPAGSLQSRRKTEVTTMTLEQLKDKLNTLEEVLCSKRWTPKATREWLNMIDDVKRQIKEMEG